MRSRLIFVPLATSFVLTCFAPGARPACAADAAPRAAAGLARLAGTRERRVVATPVRDAATAGTTSERWDELPPPARTSALGLYDSSADRMVLCGDDYASDDVWGLDLAAPGRWTKLTSSGDRPDGEQVAALALDPAAQCAYWVGAGNDYTHVGDVWRLDVEAGPRWTKIASSPPGSRPAFRTNASAIFDSRRNRLVLFGGWGRGDALADLWLLDLATGHWSAFTARGDSMLPRVDARAVYDAAHDRLLLFGGGVETEPRQFTNSTETWALDFADTLGWQLLRDAAPSAPLRSGATMLVDPADGSVLLVGGVGTSADRSPEAVYRFADAPAPHWTRLAPAGSPSRDRTASAVAYDSRRDHFLLAAGGWTPHDRFDADALALRPAPAWSAFGGDSLPRPRFAHSLAIDPIRDRVVLFGGLVTNVDGSWALTASSDVWTAPLANPSDWSPLAVAGEPPPPRAHCTLVADRYFDRMIAFGGESLDGVPTNETWDLDFTPQPTWVKMTSLGLPPPARSGHVAIFDAARVRMLVFGGSGARLFGDVWALGSSGTRRWEQLQPQGTGPTARWGASAILDPTRDRMVVYGGADSTGDREDVWALNLADLRWELLLDDANRYGGIALHTAVYDLADDRMVVYGGRAAHGDVIQVFGGATEELAFAPAPHWVPGIGGGASPRDQHAAVYDAQRGQMVLFGGQSLYGANDTWRLDLGSGTHDVWLESAHVTADGITTIWDVANWPPGEIYIERSSHSEPWHIFGAWWHAQCNHLCCPDTGLTPGLPYHYRLSDGLHPLTPEITLTAPGTPALAWLGTWPNPARSLAPTLNVALGSATPATLELFDLAGRRVASERIVPHASGVTAVRPAATLRAGLYLVRLTQDGRTVTGKFCVLQ